MSIITKELLQHLQGSIVKDVAIIQDSKSYYFSLSIFQNNNIGDPLGTVQIIDISHITNEITNHPKHMVQISVVDSFLLNVPEPTTISRPVYIRFKGFYTNARYNFAVGLGNNNFNSSNTLVLPCGDMPKDLLTIEFGTFIFDNRTDQQTEQVPFLDSGVNLRLEELNVRFKVQTISLA